MLGREDNELLTRIGPGTPMGNLMRQYWQPVLLSSELPAPDGPPVRVRALGEDLIAFRDTQGRVGLLGANCPHRGAPLFFGRNEEDGLRCIYHGWKFDVTGHCLDMPNRPADRDYREKVRAPSYRCVERNGIIWTYMGPLAEPPALPQLGWSELPAGHRLITKQLLECNYAQALEGDLDPSHVSFLHAPLDPQGRSDYQGTAGIISDKMLGEAALEQAVKAQDKNPRLNVLRTDYGLFIGARRDAGERHYWRITQYVLPSYVFVPGAVGSPVHCNAWVPMDDEHTIVWRIQYLEERPFTEQEISKLQNGMGAHVEPGGYLPASSEPAGSWMPRANRSNNYLQDRQVQRTVSFTGIRGIWAQDRACTEGMGAIMDRSHEHLGPSDVSIVQMRRLLLGAAAALRDQGTPAPGVDVVPPIMASPTLFLPKGVTWEELSKDYAGGKAKMTAPVE
jgi:phenylpropionate dioxygenase-like ring-hydroxylating dioxygenase large terminal subunit